MTKIRHHSNRPLDIYICNEGEAALQVARSPDRFHVISIRDFSATKAPVDEVATLCLSMLILRFNDLQDVHLNHLTMSDMVKYGLHYPEKGHIESALAHSKGKRPLLIYCTAGVSRSSALAYIIACSRVGPSDALRVLDSKYHWPNDRVVRLGAEVLGNPEIERALKAWKDEHRKSLGGAIIFSDSSDNQETKV